MSRRVWRRRFAVFVLGGTAPLLLTGCQVLERSLESAAYFSATSAGYAGRFRIAFGRWPANLNELEEFICMPRRARGLALVHRSCEEVVGWPYRTELVPQGRDLHLRYYARANGELVCNLRLRAPPEGGGRHAFPRIVIKSTVFSCSDGRWSRNT